MIFSALLTLFLSVLIVYALLQHKQFPMVARTLPFVSLFGIYVAWFPDSTSRMASWVGIGRGVDLMLYVWIMASGLLILVLHLKLVAQHRQITELARYVAIRGAESPAQPLAAMPAPVQPSAVTPPPPLGAAPGSPAPGPR